MPGGRRSKLTPELQRRIIRHVSNGLTDQEACRRSGISASAFYTWLAKPSDGRRTKFTELQDGIELARLEWEQFHVDMIEQAASSNRVTKRLTRHMDRDGNVIGSTMTVDDRPPDWSVSAWLLEHRSPRKWSSRAITDDDYARAGGGGTSIRITFSKDEEIASAAD